jgi:tetratricopeptide (TPR) repeat protein
MGAGDIDAALALARDLFERDDLARAEAILRDLAARAPAREDVQSLLANLLQSEGRLDAASHAMFDWAQANDFADTISTRAAVFIQQRQRQPLALQLCDAAISRGRASPALRAIAGNIARELGDFDAARRHYLAALDAGVDLDAWYVLGALAHTKRYTDPGDADVARLVAHAGDARGAPRARAASGFGLAKTYDDLGDIARAATTLREANALVRRVVPWTRDAWDAFVDARLRERIARTASRRDGFAPIFIVGLPRSGTTLTASRLAEASGARDRGELRTLRFIADTLIGGGHLGDASALAEAAQLYRVQARQDDAPARAYIDQDPMNFRYLHLVDAMFPDARIVVCRRARRDTALSLWSQDFAHADSAFASDLADIAHFARGYDRLIAYWRDTLSAPIHVLDYEALVENPTQRLAELCDFVGVHRQDGDVAAPAAIHSASVWQARQPITTASVGRWKRYAPFVPELIDAFSDAAPR